MHASALTSSEPPLRASLRPQRHMPLTRGPRQSVSLRLQSLVDPPLRGDEHHARSAGVWFSDDGSLSTDARCLTARHLALQGLLLKLEVLAGTQGPLTNRALRLLTGNRLSHVYACAEDFRRLACETSWARGNPTTHAAFIDEVRDWLVLDAEQAFIDHSARPSSMLISALAHLAELPFPAQRAWARLDGAPGLQASELGPLMLDTARKLIRTELGEAGITLSVPAAELVERMGPTALVHWLLADLPTHVIPMDLAAPRPQASVVDERPPMEESSIHTSLILQASSLT